MPTKTDAAADPKEVSLTSLALVLEPEQLDSWLASNQVTTKIKNKKTGAITERTAPRVLTLSTVAPPELFIAVTRYSAGVEGTNGYPGGTVPNNGTVLADIGNTQEVKSGYVGRAVRRSLFGMFMPAFDADTWEAERDERITSERSNRMSALAAARGESVEAVKAKLSMLDKLRSNSKVMALLMETEPDIAALLSEFDTDS